MFSNKLQIIKAVHSKEIHGQMGMKNAAKYASVDCCHELEMSCVFYDWLTKIKALL